MTALPSETNSYLLPSENLSANFRNIEVNQCDIVEKWFVICLHSKTNEYQTMTENLMQQHCHLVNDIKLFDCKDRCIDFMTDLSNAKICLILCKSLVDTLLPLIYDLPQLQFIYILLDNNHTAASSSTNRWAKIKGSFPSMVGIFDDFKQSIRKSEYDLMSISIVSPSSDGSVNELEPSFMYSQLFKDIILRMQYDHVSKTDFVNHLRKQYAANPAGLKLVNTFEQEYSSRSPFWWYSKEVFIYEPLNRALRTQNTEILVRMGFFIQDLHREIERSYGKQSREKRLIYRGQAMKKSEFEKLQKNKGGLLSFNNFLSTSTDKDVSLLLADSCSSQEDFYGILFQIEIDPLVSSVLYADLEKQSQFEAEKETLFSMHTIFRIEGVQNISEGVWQVNLKSTDDSDEQLTRITESIRQQIQHGSTSMSLGHLLFRLGEYDNAKKIYDNILASTSANDIRSRYQLYNVLGSLAYAKSEYSTALSYFQKILDMCPLPDDCKHFDFTDVYNNMAMVHHTTGNYVTASEYYEIIAEIREGSPTPDILKLGQVYNNIAVVNNAAGRHRIALEYFRKSLDIFESSLPPAHPDLAFLYNNIGMINDTMGERNTALQYFEKALQVQKKSLPSNHLSLVGTLNNLGSVKYWLAQYQTAVEHYQNALHILQTVGSSNQSELPSIHNNIAQLYKTLSKYDQALPHYFEAIKIQKTISQSNDPKLAVFYVNIAMLYRLMGDYLNAIKYLEKAQQIQKASLPANHPEFVRTLHSLGIVYQAKKENHNALSYYGEALAIQKVAFPATHPDLASIYNNMADIESSLGHGDAALNYLNEVLSIQKAHFPPSHPEIGRTFASMGTIYMRMNNDTEAEKCFREAFKIYKETLPAEHPEFGKLYFNVALQYCIRGNYSKALEKAEKARQILERTLPPNHPDLVMVYENISKMKQMISFGSGVPWTL